MNTFAGLVIIGMVILVSVSVSGKSFASIPMENIEWQLVFVTDNRTCSNYDYQMTNTYHEIAFAYMNAYELGNYFQKPLCMTQYKFSEMEFSSTTDLLIIVYGKDLGREVLNRYQVGGVYYHPGGDISKNHVIMLCDCPNFEFSEPAWTMSHELSHFILNYRGYGPDIVESKIHEYDLRHDRCIDTRTTDDCKNMKYNLQVDAIAYSYVVVPPYLGGFDEYEKSKTVTVDELKQQITKMWSRGSINNSDYLVLMGYDTKSRDLRASNGYFDQSKKFFTDGAKDSKSNIVHHDGTKRLSYNQMDAILSKIPKSMIKSTGEVPVTKLPGWFKNTSEMWTNKQISDKEYFLAMDYLLKKISRNNAVNND